MLHYSPFTTFPKSEFHRLEKIKLNVKIELM